MILASSPQKACHESTSAISSLAVFQVSNKTTSIPALFSSSTPSVRR